MDQHPHKIIGMVRSPSVGFYPPDTTGIALRRQLKIEEKTAHVGRLKKDHEVGDTVLRKQGEIVATHSKEPEAQN